MSNYNETLVSILHEAFVTCGQILNPDHIAEFIADYEWENDIELTTKAITSSVREAKDRACDSFINNAVDSRSAWGDEAADAEIARWKAQRPKKVRQDWVKKVLSVEEHDEVSSLSRQQCFDIISRLGFNESAEALQDCSIEDVRETCRRYIKRAKKEQGI
jgi:hypothetical protein